MTARPPRRKKIATAVSLSAVLPVIHVRVGGGARHGGRHLGTGQPPTTVTTERSPSVSGRRTARRRPRHHRSTSRTPVSPCTDETSGGVCCMGRNGRGDEREDAWGRIRTLRARSHLHHEDLLLWLCSVSGRIVDRAGDWEWMRCCRLTLLFFFFLAAPAAAARRVCCYGAECELIKCCGSFRTSSHHRVRACVMAIQPMRGNSNQLLRWHSTYPRCGGLTSLSLPGRDLGMHLMTSTRGHSGVVITITPPHRAAQSPIFYALQTVFPTHDARDIA
jgi:hypothetical protein